MLAYHLYLIKAKTLPMTQDQSANSKTQAQQQGATEDPPVNTTEQNKPEGEKKESGKVDVPAAAVESYKESGKEGEE